MPSSREVIRGGPMMYAPQVAALLVRGPVGEYQVA